MLSEEYTLRPIDLGYPEERGLLVRFLAEQGLGFEADIDAAFGIFGPDDTLSGCGCAAGPLLKCFAVSGGLRGRNALGPLVSALIQDRFSKGIYHVRVITRAGNESLFAGCGLCPAVRTDQLVMLENIPDGPRRFAEGLRRAEDGGRTAGAIVMNANPFTLGHRSLVEYALTRCELLHIFVVEEDRSLFPTGVRLSLVQAGTADLPNVRVHLSGPYIISAATFPTYFLKEGEDAAALQSELDITLFARFITPPLHITARFAGEELQDPVTARYNEAMARILPAHGIEFVQIPRLQENGRTVSASLVREGLRSREAFAAAAPMLPQTTREYIQRRFFSADTGL